MRGFWGLLLLFASVAPVSAQSQQPFLVLDARGHTATVNQVAFTPDGKYLITVSGDKTVRLWDPLTGEPTHTIRLPIDKGRDGYISDAALSPDGKRLVIAHSGFSQQGRFPVYVLSIPEGEIVGAFLGHRDSVNTVNFSADGKRIVSGSTDRTIRIWDADTGKTLHVLEGHTRSVSGVSFSPRGDSLVSCSTDNTLRFWNVADARSYSTFANLDGSPTGVVWSPTGNLIMSGTNNGSVYILDGKGELLKHHSGMVHEIKVNQFSNDGGSIIVSTGNPLKKSGGTTMAATARATGDYFKTFAVQQRFYHVDYVQAARVLESKQWVASAGGPNNETYLWRVTDPSNYSTLVGRGKAIYGTGWSRDGSRIAWGNQILILAALDQTFSCTDLEMTGPPGSSFTHFGGDGITFPTRFQARIQHPDGNVVTVNSNSTMRLLCGTWIGRDRVVFGTDYGLSVHDARTGKHLDSLIGPSQSVFTLALSPNGKYLLAGSEQVLHVYELAGNNIRKESRLGFIGDFNGDRCPISQVMPGSAAAKAGLKVGDTVLAFTDAGGNFIPCTSENFYQIRGAAGTNVKLRVENSDREVREVVLTRELLEVHSNEPLLSLFVAGHEWIAWTPQGYYATSPGGESLMGWQVNRGYDKLPEFHSASQFRKTLYRPDVLKLLLSTGSLEKALEIADGKTGVTTKKVDIADVLPPKVSITNLKSGLKVQDGVITVEARALSTGEHPITSLELLLDGRPTRGQAGVKRLETPKLGAIDESWRISLYPGQYSVAIKADSKVSSGVSDPIEIVVESPKDEVILPDLYVLTIGISDYAGDLKLNYAAKDAEVLAETIRTNSKDLFRNVNVTSLTNKNATRAGILKEITDLRKKMTQRDLAIVSFAGHGERDSDLALYLLPVDVNADDLLSSAIPASQIRTAFASMPGKILFLLDACHSGAVEVEKKRSKSALTDDLVRDLRTDDAGVIVMCASTGREFALESNEHRHGLFTLALVEGLSGKAAKDKLRRIDDAIYFHHLDAYVTDRVKELSQGRQHPVTARPASIRSFPLARPK